MFFSSNSTEFLPIQLPIPPIPETLPIPPIPLMMEIPPTIQVPPPPTIIPPPLPIEILPPIPLMMEIPSTIQVPPPPTIIPPPPPIEILPPIPVDNTPIQFPPPPGTIPNSPEIPPIATTPLPSPPPIDPLTGMSMEELRVVELTNNIRLQNGLSPLAPNSQLAAAADVHSQNMAYQDFFSHVGLDGSQPWDRANRAGYFSSFVGENIGAGYSTADEAVQGWINSPGHLDNILNPNYTQIGVGYEYLANDGGMENFNHYWTQVFGN